MLRLRFPQGHQWSRPDLSRWGQLLKLQWAKFGFSRWQHLLSIKWWEEHLSAIVNVLLRLGTILLLVILLVFSYRVLQDQGYTIEPFSVPKSLMESGYDGAVVARKIQDEVARIKGAVQSIKQDSVQLIDQNQPEFSVAVLGIGVSLRSVTYHLRELLGRKNLSIRGEITQSDQRYHLTLRMTGFEPREYSLPARPDSLHHALQALLRKGGEAIINNLDPYRLAVLCYNEGRYEEAVLLVQRILDERPAEAHWAYLAWGSVLDKQGQTEAALEKFERSVKLKPDFELAWARIAWSYNELGQKEKAIAAMRTTASLADDLPPRLVNLGWLLANNQNYAAADSAFEVAARLSNDQMEVVASWLDSKLTRRDTVGITSLIKRLEGTAKDNAQGYVMLAMANMAKGDTARAAKHVNQAFELDPTNLMAARFAIQVAYYLQKDIDASLRVYNRVVWKNTAEPFLVQHIHNMGAMCMNWKGLHDQAFVAARKAIATNPKMPYPYTTLAETFAFNQQWDSCYVYLSKALRMGFSPSDFVLTDPPYPTIMQRPEFKRLLEEYKLKN